MNRLLPSSTNDAYSGAQVSVLFLGLISLLTIGPALIHATTPLSVDVLKFSR